MFISLAKPGFITPGWIKSVAGDTDIVDRVYGKQFSGMAHRTKLGLNSMGFVGWVERSETHR